MPLHRDISWQNIKQAASGRRTPNRQEGSDRGAGSTSTHQNARPSKSSSLTVTDGTSQIASSSQPELLAPGSSQLSHTPSNRSGASASAVPASSTTSNKSKPTTLALLRVQVLGATNLTPKDRNGKADPFVTLTIPGLTALAGKNPHVNSNAFRKQTSTDPKTLDPKWKDEVWDFEITTDWFPTSDWQAEEEEGPLVGLEPETEIDETTEALVQASLHAEEALMVDEQTAPALEVEEVEKAPVTGAEESKAPLAPKPSRPAARRMLSNTASKVLSTSAKGMKMLPKGAAAGARAVAKGTPRPMKLRRAQSAGASRLWGTRGGLVSSLEIVVWDKDFARREYMGEACCPVWQWRSGSRHIEWSGDDQQPFSLPLVSSRRNAKVSGQVQIRVGLVAVPGSPVKSLEKLYQRLLVAGVAVSSKATGIEPSSTHKVQPHHLHADIEEQIRAGLRAIPASQSVGTSEHFVADNGFSSDEEEQEVLDSDDDDDDSDSDLDSLTDADFPTSTEDELTGNDDTDQDYFGQKLRARKASGSPLPSPSPVPKAQSPAEDLALLTAGIPVEQVQTPGGHQRKVFGFARKPRKEGSSADLSIASDNVGTPLFEQTPGKHRRRKATNEAAKAERTERRLAKRQAKQARKQGARDARRDRQARQRNYNLQADSDVMGIVMMEIKGAKDLPRWKNSLRTGFDMDPFTIVAFGQKIFRTRVCRHTLNPEWDEKLLIRVRQSELRTLIKLSIYDWDKISANDHVGSCEIPLTKLIDATPKPDPETGIYDAELVGRNEMQEFVLPLTRSGGDEEAKYGHCSPTITFQAKFTPYAALRQRFWQQMCQQFDTNDTEQLSALELTTMLDSLGSTLTGETIRSFFTRFNLNADSGELSFEQVIRCLEDEIKRPYEEKRRVPLSSNVSSGVQTPAVLPKDPSVPAINEPHSGMDVTGPPAPLVTLNDEPEDSLRPHVISDGHIENASAQPHNEKSTKPLTVEPISGQSSASSTRAGTPARKDSDLGMSSRAAANEAGDLKKVRSLSSSMMLSPERASTADSATSTASDAGEMSSSVDDYRPIERVIHLKSCPLCHMPRLSKKGDGDVVTHLAVCASQDWRRVDSLVVGNFVTANQAHRKWLNKIVISATRGSYKLGANSANIIVQDRETGELQEEKMQAYVRLGIRILYQGARSRVESARVRKMFKNMSIKQGRKYDSPASAREIPGFIAYHNLNVDEFAEPLESFKTFNQFFYRKLKEGARPVSEPDNPDRLVSVADCRTMVFPNIDEATRLWIKGREFSIERLLGDAYKGQLGPFINGSLSIARLAPQDYHHYHSPVDATVGKMSTISGTYWTVSPMSVRQQWCDVYGENTRVIVPLHSEAFGTVFVVNIGAFFVGSVVVTVKEGDKVKRGDDLGYYAFGGSTTVCVYEKGRVKWDDDLLANSSQPFETLVKQGTGVGRAVGGGQQHSSHHYHHHHGHHHHHQHDQQQQQQLE